MSKEVELVQIPSQDVDIGMYVAKLDRPWTETPFLFQGFLLRNPRDVQRIKDTCEYVFIDVLRTVEDSKARLTSGNMVLGHPTFNKTQYYNINEFEKEIEKASGEYQKTLSGVKEMLSHAKDQNALKIGAIREQIEPCVDSIERNPSAMVWLTRIKHVDEYTAEHCLNVGLLAASLGRHLGLARSQLEFLALCGILHDVGKMLVDQELLNKPGELTEEEFKQIQKHTLKSAEMLGKDKSLPKEVKVAALHHHERIDGTGYPARMPGKRLSFYTKVISVVDVYDAITSERCYSSAKPPTEALKIIYENRNKQFDEELAVKFIEFMGLYPPGCIVEMNSGEIAVVLSSNPKKRLHPRVVIVLDKDKKRTDHRIVNLANRSGDSPLSIKRALEDRAYGVDIEELSDLFRHSPEEIASAVGEAEDEQAQPDSPA